MIKGGNYNKYINKRELNLGGKYSNLTYPSQKVRKALITYVVDNGVPFNISKDIHRLSDLQEELSINIVDIIYDLLEKRILKMDEEGNINFLYPVSALPTNHKVTLSDGRKFHAMCGIDAMGSTLTFNQDIHIESICSQCGEEIILDIKDGEIANLSSENIYVIHLDSDENEEWAGNC